jgi:hypothetical protein
MIQNKREFKYTCDKCNYFTNNKYDFNRHNLRQKHLLNIKKTEADTFIDTKKTYKCICGAVYKYHSGYYRHRKTCSQNINDTNMQNKDDINYKELIFKVLNENSSLQELLIKQQDQFMKQQDQFMKQQNETNKKFENLILHIKPNHTITNCNNKTINNNHVNIMMFLNDKCKDAMTIQDFAEKLVVSIEDLEKKKFDCLTNTILKNLKSLSITERPVHCGNIHKKEWYLHDKNNGWELDNGEKLIIKTEFGINKKYQDEFKRHYPNYSTQENIRDKYMNLIHKTLTDLPENEKSRLLNILAKDLTIDDI